MSESKDISQNNLEAVESPKQNAFIRLLKTATAPLQRITNIDWNKDTPKDVNTWKSLSQDERLDWSIWHEIRLQHTFATLTILLEIIAAVIGIVFNQHGTGISVLIGVAAVVVMILTGLFSKILYRMLRAIFWSTFIGGVISMIIFSSVSDDGTRTTAIIIDFIVCFLIFGIAEASGSLGKKVSNFPGPKEKRLKIQWIPPGDFFFNLFQICTNTDNLSAIIVFRNFLK